MKTIIKYPSIIIVITIVFLSIGCSKSNDTGSTVTPVSTADLSLKGDFKNVAHPTSGVASVNLAKDKLTFTNFKTDQGPLLNVYLVTDLSTAGKDYVDLGLLKGISGNYIYDIPANTDLTKYKIVSVWCVQASVNFGSAELLKQ